MNDSREPTEGYCPLPWVTDPEDPVVIHDADGRCVSEVLGQYTTEAEDAVLAARMVLAMNAHAALVAALDGLVMHVDALVKAGMVHASEFDLTNHRAALKAAKETQ